MKRTNWIKNKKIDKVLIGQRWELKPEHKKNTHFIHIIDIITIFKSSCDVRNVINHSHLGNYFKSEILNYYKLVEKKPIQKANGKIRAIDLSQS